MPLPPTSEPDPSKADPSATGVLRARPEDTRFETDFAQLAACFSAKSGGGLSPELSTELALEIVLNEVVEQACLTTGATGAAIALERDGEMVCRASSGATAPTLGSRMDAASGLSGESIRTRRTQRCEDVLADSRVDLEASQRLGVRSVMVMPLIRGDAVVGLFELFSSLPSAFGERDELTLNALAFRVLSSLERAAAPLTLQNEPLPLPEIEGIVPEIPESSLPESVPVMPEENSPGSGFDFVTWSLRAAVLVCAVMLGLLLGRHFGARKAVVHVHPAAPPSSAGAATGGNAGAAIISSPSPSSDVNASGKQPSAAAPATQSDPAKASAKTVPVPPGSLLVFENGKEIFRMPPTRSETNPKDGTSAGMESAMQRASSAEPVKIAEAPPAAAEVLHRVEPEYPEDARQQGIQGAVVLEVHIGRDGAVQDVQVVSGRPELAQASMDAVKQWRFRPRQLNGSAVPMQTRITLNFRLPQ
jgi:TonB family protein